VHGPHTLTVKSANQAFAEIGITRPSMMPTTITCHAFLFHIAAPNSMAPDCCACIQVALLLE
jgi:hypothetical protein